MISIYNCPPSPPNSASTWKISQCGIGDSKVEPRWTGWGVLLVTRRPPLGLKVIQPLEKRLGKFGGIKTRDVIFGRTVCWRGMKGFVRTWASTRLMLASSFWKKQSNNIHSSTYSSPLIPLDYVRQATWDPLESVLYWGQTGIKSLHGFLSPFSFCFLPLSRLHRPPNSPAKM